MPHELADRNWRSYVLIQNVAMALDRGAGESFSTWLYGGGRRQGKTYRQITRTYGGNLMNWQIQKEASWAAFRDFIKPERKMLDLTKKYRTRDGREVTGLTLGYTGDMISGDIKIPGNRRVFAVYWWLDGRWRQGEDSPQDLVPACDPIVLDRKYKTAKGEPVELFKIADGRAWGRYLHGYRHGDCERQHIDGAKGEWRSYSWDVNDHTLVPAVRKEKRVYWLVHRRDVWDGSRGGRQASAFISHAAATAVANSSVSRNSKNPVVAITGPHEFEIEVSE